MFWDTHLHTHFSGDSQTSPDEIVTAAKKIGLSGICFTDHLDLDYPVTDRPDFFSLDLDNYIKECHLISKKYQDILPIRIGLELGLQPHLAALHTQLLATHLLDFVIGSTHVVHGFDPYYQAFFEGRGEDEAYQEYFEATLENIQAFEGFDVYGHLDYVVRYGTNQNRYYSYQKFSDIIDEILKILIYKGKGLEINTGGYKYGLGHPNPTEDILKRYHDLGGEIITIGSDAHQTRFVGYEFEKIESILKNTGFLYFTVFENRKPRFIRID